jgi:VanZ family protein
VIFFGSGDALSDRRTSRFIGPVLRWFKPDLSEATVRQCQAVIRKGGHLTEYAVLALLALRAFTRPSRLLPSVWSWRAAALALSFCVLYAMSDELHQAFVPTRQGSPLDVVIDSVGAAIGIGVAWLATKWHRRAVRPEPLPREVSTQAIEP